MKNLTLIDHPVLQHKLGRLRGSEINNFEFGNLVREVTSLLTYEATRNLDLVPVSVEASERPINVHKISKPPVIVSLMRAGNGMIDGARQVLQNSQVGHIGIYRDKTIGCTVEYFFRIPKMAAETGVVLLDPVIGTANSMLAAIERLKQIDVKKITVLTIVASREGMERLCRLEPDVAVFALAADDQITSDGVLSPGIGDVSARIYNYD